MSILDTRRLWVSCAYWEPNIPRLNACDSDHRDDVVVVIVRRFWSFRGIGMKREVPRGLSSGSLKLKIGILGIKRYSTVRRRAS